VSGGALVLTPGRYLPVAPETLRTDPLLAGLSEDRRRTMIASEDGAELRFDVRLQGEDETVFLTFPGHSA
jgi:protocatechuate 3,4-dioxygenase, alpha subunit